MKATLQCSTCKQLWPYINFVTRLLPDLTWYVRGGFRAFSFSLKDKITEQDCLAETEFVSYSSDLTPASPSPNKSIELCAYINISVKSVSTTTQTSSPSVKLLPTGLGCCCMPVILVCSDTRGWYGSLGSRRALSPILHPPGQELPGRIPGWCQWAASCCHPSS